MTKTVGIDLGHGNDTYEKKKSKFVIVDGKVYEEHDFNSKVAIELDKILKRCGFKTVMYQQPNSPEIGLTERISYYNKLGVDLLWSIHANAGTATAKGMASFYWHTSEKAKKLADLYAEEVKNYGYTTYGSGSRESVPKTWSDFAMCRDPKMVSNLSENGFMTNPDDFKLIFQSDKYVKDVAEIHAKATCKYFGVEYVEEVVTQPTYTPKPDKVETVPAKELKGDEIMKVTSPALRAIVEAELRDLTDSKRYGKEAFSTIWLDKFLKNELTVSDAIALLYAAKRKGI